jgi:hypothetical protein
MPTRPAPRKPDLNAPSAYRADGTVAESIITQIRAGSDAYAAAGTEGIPPPLLRTMLNDGHTQWMRAVASTADWATDFTPAQQDLALFYWEVQRAIATSQSRSSLLLERHIEGGLTKTTTRRKIVAGSVIEEFVTVETLLPSLEALKFKLERLYADVYGPKATLRLSSVDLSDTEEVGRALEEAMEVVARRLQAIDAGEAPGAPPPPVEATESPLSAAESPVETDPP